MTLDWIHFTPGAALAGGALIGLASALYLLGNGRIAGIAGLVGEPLAALLRGQSLAPQASRLLFLLGLLLAPWLWQLGPPRVVWSSLVCWWASARGWATAAPAATACAG